MGVYSQYVLPRLTHLSMRQAQLRPYRERVAGGARGRVLEIGFGSGLNLAYYNQTVDEIIGIDASPQMLALAERAVANSKHKVTLLARSADEMPLDDKSIDTIVVTCRCAVSLMWDGQSWKRAGSFGPAGRCDLSSTGYRRIATLRSGRTA